MHKKKSIVLYLSLFLLSISSSDASDIIFSKNKVDNLVRLGKCSDAWEVLWSSAKGGNAEARALLSSSIAAGVMAPRYLSKTDPLNFLTLLTLYSMEARSNISIILSEDFLKSNKNFKFRTEILECLGSKSDKASCLNVAVKAGMIPPFSEFASVVDASNVRGAVCLRKNER